MPNSIRGKKSPFNILKKKSSFSGKKHRFFNKKIPKLRNLTISVAFYDKFQTCYTLVTESFQINNRRTSDTFTSDIISWQVRVKKRSQSFHSNCWKPIINGGAPGQVFYDPARNPANFFGPIFLTGPRRFSAAIKSCLRNTWNLEIFQHLSSHPISFLQFITFCSLFVGMGSLSDRTHGHFRMLLITG